MIRGGHDRTRAALIRVLMALHPRRWRAQYGAELRDHLQTGPLSPVVVVDVLRNAARQHGSQHPITSRVFAALLASAVVEWIAVRAGVTDNILWPPSTPLRAATLVALLLPWLPVAAQLIPAVRNRRQRSAVGP